MVGLWDRARKLLKRNSSPSELVSHILATEESFKYELPTKPSDLNEGCYNIEMISRPPIFEDNSDTRTKETLQCTRNLIKKIREKEKGGEGHIPHFVLAYMHETGYQSEGRRILFEMHINEENLKTAISRREEEAKRLKKNKVLGAWKIVYDNRVKAGFDMRRIYIQLLYPDFRSSETESQLS